MGSSFPVGGPKHTVVVGGGLSGLGAAVALSALRLPVILLEQKPNLGGRSYSFSDSRTRETIDNGQHVLIAGYERTIRFLDSIGTRHLVRVQDRPSFLFHHPERGFRRLTLPKLPPPLHLLGGILHTGLFSLSDKLHLLRAGAALHGRPDAGGEDRTVAQWLDSLGQTAELRRSFWEPLAVSIMNEHIVNASAKVFVHALREAFFNNWRSAAFAVPRVGLSELFVDPARSFIVDRGGAVCTSADVVGVSLAGGVVTGVKVKDGPDIACGALILGIPPLKLGSLLPEKLLTDLSLHSMITSPVTPILSIHLWFENDFMPHDIVGLIGRRIQWIFNRRKITRKEEPGGHISCTISAANEFVGMTNADLVRLATEDLRSVYPSTPGEPTHSVIIRERRATIASTPDVEQLRPSQKTSVPNLFLAGDWTATGYPATIEGAIVSGERCASCAASWLEHRKVSPR